MIVVTGASGQLGRLVIRELLKSLPAGQLAAAVRSPEKVADFADLGVHIRKADYTQPDTLATAFSGADKVLFISANEVGRRVSQHANVITAAKEAGVGLVGYVSILHAAGSPLNLAEEHRQTEALLAESGVPHVLLRNGWYTENYTGGIPTALQYGTLMGCAGDGKISSATRADFAAGAAAVMSADGQAGKVYELAGDEAYTLSEFAAELSAQAGKQVSYQNLSEDAYAQALQNAGVPAPFAMTLAQSETGASQGGLFDDSKTLSKLIGRPTTPLRESIQAALNAMAG
ncbi:MAG: SDR family oxidoreductase [Caldilineaceae bacterium]|nr:SDR family oxidoreductase [Caldilineaceae bacterium]